jgi:SAM-dependent methyltransferase/uncharacterized protein YbaR (Trm112 family)
MLTELLDILVCPECRTDLTLEVVDGTMENIVAGFLVCRDCSSRYPVDDDIPFFAPEIVHGGVRNQQSTYSTWWDRYHDEASVVDESHRDFFYNSLRIKAEEIEGKRVLDAGCGNGRFSFVVSRYQPRLLVAFDVSSGVLHARKAISRHNPKAQVGFVQGDITRPPFRAEVFDIVFSWGVIHHTPRAEETFSIISQLVVPGGTLGVYVYEFHPLYRWRNQPILLFAYLRSLLLIRPLRAVCSHLPAPVVHALFLPVYHLEKILDIGVVGCHGPPQERWSKQRYFRVVIDRFKTRYASEHQLEEVLQWFHQAGYDQVVVGWRPRLSVTAIKLSQDPQHTFQVMFVEGPEVDESIRRYVSTQIAG